MATETPEIMQFKAYCDALCSWARWQGAVRAGRKARKCAQLASIYRLSSEVARAMRVDLSENVEPIFADALTREGGLTVREGDVLLALMALGRRRVRRSFRRHLGAGTMPLRGRDVPIELLAALLDRPLADLRASLDGLASHRLVGIADPGPDARPSTASSTRKPSSRFAPAMPIVVCDPEPLAALVIPSADRARLEAALARIRPPGWRAPEDAPPSVTVVLIGRAGAGKVTLARAMSAYCGLQMHTFSPPSSSLPPDDGGDTSSRVAIQLAHYFAVSGPAAVLDFDTPFEAARSRWADATAQVHTIAAELEKSSHTMGPFRLSIVGLPDASLLTPALAAQADFVVSLEPTDPEHRAELWRSLASPDRVEPDLDLDVLAPGLAMGPGHIVRAISQAVRIAREARGVDARATCEEMRAALHRTAAMGAPPTPVVTPTSTDAALPYDKIVLPAETRTALDELIAFATLPAARLATLGLDEAGLDLSPDKRNLVALFEGPPGTGKTACAQALAQRLGRTLVTAEIGALLGPFIGQSEQRVTALFEAARRGALLFIDEADALLAARRDEGHSSTDTRLVNLLLVELERHAGPVVLATNFASTLDPALARRIHFRIPFVAPDEGSRRALWRLYVPESVPGAESLNLDLLARDLSLTGAQIRTVARRCIVRSVVENRPVSERDVRALAAEVRCTGATAPGRVIAGFGRG